jgi:hypothetical protein
VHFQWDEEPTRCFLVLFITLMICSTCFGHLYAHHQELTIIYHCSPHGTSASWALMVVKCGLAGYVAGLAALERGEWSTARPNRTLPHGKDPVPIVQDAGWAPGPVWTAENLVPPEFDPRTFQPVVSRYTDRVTWPIYGNR